MTHHESNTSRMTILFYFSFLGDWTGHCFEIFVLILRKISKCMQHGLEGDYYDDVDGTCVCALARFDHNTLALVFYLVLIATLSYHCLSFHLLYSLFCYLSLWGLILFLCCHSRLFMNRLGSSIRVCLRHSHYG